MLPTLALALALAAPVPKPPPFPLRTDPLPKEFKPETLAEMTKPTHRKGTVELLAWFAVEPDESPGNPRAITLKKFDKADGDGCHYALCFLYWDAKKEAWKGWLDNPPLGGPPGLSCARLAGYDTYKTPPTDKQLTSFLKDVSWAPALGERVLLGSGGAERVTRRVTAGGFDRAVWKTHFDRDPPVELFPELKVKEK